MVEQTLSLRPLGVGDTVPGAIRIARCTLSVVEAFFLEFVEPVVLEACTIGGLEAMSADFLGGLAIRRCVFNGSVDLQAGGHNRNGAVIQLEGTVFREFVSFFDQDGG